MEFQCKICLSNVSAPMYCSHVNRHVAKDSEQQEIQFDCPVCDKKFLRISNLRKHLLSKHMNIMRSNDAEYCNICVNDDMIVSPPAEVGDMDEDFGDNEIETEHENVDLQYTPIEKAMQLHFSLMSKIYLSNKNATEIFNIMKQFVAETFSHIEQNLKGANTIEEVMSLFQLLAFDVNRSLDLVDTEQKLLTIAKRTDILFEPMKFVIRQTTVQNVGELEEENYFGTIMPIKEQIRKFLELPNVYTEIMETQTKSLLSNNYVNMVNGTIWSQMLQYYEGKIAVPIALYFDEFNPDKDTSSHAAENRLSAFYFSFPTLPDYVSMNINNIFIALLYKSYDMDNREVASHGMDPALNALLDVFIPLGREGIQINIDGVQTQIYIVLTQVFGDNAALNAVLGFSRSFIGSYVCRICMIPRTEMEHSIRINEELIRNEQNYSECLAGHSVETKKGVKYNCLLNTLEYFSVLKNISVDIMHDAFLGVLKYDLIIILIYYIKLKRVFTLSQFNQAKNQFDYGKKSVGDRTSKILDSHLTGNPPKIHMAAKEMWTLMENLPLILMDLVPHYQLCNIFKFVVIVTKLIHAITKRMYSEENIADMDMTIKEHHSMYLTIFNEPNYQTHLTFKFHVMLHYALYIRSLGPLRNSMTFRFEAKHQQLKRYARQCFSRVNLPYSLCRKFCLEHSNFFSRNENIFVELKNPSFDKNPCYSSSMSNIKYCSKIEYKGYLFELKDVVKKQETTYVIKGIAVNFAENKAFLYCQKINTVFDTTTNFHRIRQYLNSFSEHDISSITSRPINVHSINSNKFLFFRN